MDDIVQFYHVVPGIEYTYQVYTTEYMYIHSYSIWILTSRTYCLQDLSLYPSYI